MGGGEAGGPSGVAASTAVGAHNPAHARISAVAEIARVLVKAYDEKAKVNIMRLKSQVSSKYSLPSMPKLMEILAALPEGYRDKLSPFLRAKPVRSASGIAVIAVMCKPHRCPHIAMTGGVCVYCLPEDGHQLLTDRGFLTLREVEAVRASGAPLLFATYNRGTEHLEYQAASALVVNPFGTHSMVEITQDNESHRWAPGSDEYGRSPRGLASMAAKGSASSASSGALMSGGAGEAASAAAPGAGAGSAAASAGAKREREAEGSDGEDAEARLMPSNSVSLLVTADHRMLLKQGRASFKTSGKTGISWEGKKVPKLGDPTKKSWIIDPYKVVLAGSLLQSDENDAIKLRACAPGGMAAGVGVDDLPPFKQLRLLTPAQRAAFLELYGYWLGDGTLQFKRGVATAGAAVGSGRDEVLFAPVKAADKVWLREQFAAVGLQEHRDFSVGAPSTANQISIRVFDDAWVELFFGEYASKYLSASSSMNWSAGLMVGCAGCSVEAMAGEPLAGSASTGAGASAATHDAVSSAAMASEDIKSAKWIAYWAWRLSQAHAGCVLAGLRRADGEEASGEPSINTSSVRFRDEIVRLALHAGCSPTFRIRYDAGEHRGIDRWGGAYLANHANWKVVYAPSTNSQYAEPVLMQKRDVRTVPYTGRTWCITVPNGFIVARRVHVRESDGVVTKASRPLVVGNCPGGPDSDFEYSTQAYTGYEPTSMRAIRARYNPFLQTRARLEQLRGLGHAVDKVEFIIMGGTFLSLDAAYRDEFVRQLHDALSGHVSSSVSEAVSYGEHGKAKCVAITIETRPDYCLRPHINAMLSYGCTRIEIGVQSVYEDVARDTNRGHTVAAVSSSFELAKDAGYKVVTHMMPDLPRMGWERDMAGFQELFENPCFRPDGMKLYPTLVIRGTGLYELWRTGAYRNYPPDVLVDLVARALALVPPWTRVYRIQRDIPMPLVTSGVEHGNLRELALARQRDLGLACRDVRTREAGIRDIHHRVKPDQVELVRRDYYANGGWETFLAYEDPASDTLVGLLRLRKCSQSTFRPELKGRVSIVRELHVYGTAVPVSARDPSKFQHRGYGTLLMEEAARIARDEHGADKIAVISGVGTRGYYRKLGYELDGPYMSMRLS